LAILDLIESDGFDVDMEPFSIETDSDFARTDRARLQPGSERYKERTSPTAVPAQPQPTPKPRASPSPSPSPSPKRPSASKPLAILDLVESDGFDSDDDVEL
jgi:hypothetical protein